MRLHLQHEPPPPHALGLRTVALFEVLKGLLAIIVAVLLLRYLGKDFSDVVEKFILKLHINPDHHLGREILRAADKVTDRRLWLFFFGALGYSVIRFAEGYGLWHGRAWAEWFGIVSGSLYLPFEIVALVRRASLLHWAVLLINIGVVVYLGWVRWNDHKAYVRARMAAEAQQGG